MWLQFDLTKFRLGCKLELPEKSSRSDAIAHLPPYITNSVIFSIIRLELMPYFRQNLPNLVNSTFSQVSVAISSPILSTSGSLPSYYCTKLYLDRYRKRTRDTPFLGSQHDFPAVSEHQKLHISHLFPERSTEHLKLNVVFLIKAIYQ